MCQHRLHQSHSCPLVATQKPEILLPFDEVTILGRPCPLCGLQADEAVRFHHPPSDMQALGSWGRGSDSSCPLGTWIQSITSHKVLVTLSRGLCSHLLLANSGRSGPVRCADRVLARSGLGKQYVRGTLIEQNMAAGGLWGVWFLQFLSNLPHTHTLEAQQKKCGVSRQQLFSLPCFTELSHRHCDQFCLEVNDKVLENGQLRDPGSVHTSIWKHSGGSDAI